MQGGTSPSMQEAIAGMLSISQNWPPKVKRNMSLLEEDVNNVHQDEDYSKLKIKFKLKST